MFYLICVMVLCVCVCILLLLFLSSFVKCSGICIKLKTYARIEVELEAQKEEKSLRKGQAVFEKRELAPRNNSMQY